MRAAENGHTECVRLLIDAGAKKEARDTVRVGCCFALEFARFSLDTCTTISAFAIHEMLLFFHSLP